MTRSLRVAILSASLFTIAAPIARLEAQSTQRAVALGISGGVSLPLGDLGDAVNSGYNITGHLHFAPRAIMPLRLRADVSYDRWAIEGANRDFRTLGFVANGVYDLPAASTAMARPYVLGGLGVYNSRDADTDVSDTNLGVQAGAGMSFVLSGFSTFLEAKFVNVFGDGGSARYIPVTFGVRF